MTRKMILLSLLVLNGCQEQTEVSKQDLPSPRSQVKEYVDNLTDADFQETLKKNRRFQPISGLSKYFLFPEYESRPNGGQYIWGDRHEDFHRLTLTIKDYSFNNSEQEGEIVFDVGEGYGEGHGARFSGGSKTISYKVSFLCENERFVLDKVLVTDRGYSGNNTTEELWNHRDESPAIESLLGKLIEF